MNLVLQAHSIAPDYHMALHKCQMLQQSEFIFQYRYVLWSDHFLTMI